MPDGRKAEVLCVLHDHVGNGNGLLASLLGQRTNATLDPKNECDAMRALSAILCEVYNDCVSEVAARAGERFDAIKAKHEKEMAKGWAVVDKLKAEHEKAMLRQLLHTAGIVEAGQKLRIQLTFMEARAMKAEEELAKFRAEAVAVPEAVTEPKAPAAPPEA
ncbi:MAG: hypothetical protein Q7R85_02955 [bacterium]|nr:hypothetical protein [bacterium]